MNDIKALIIFRYWFNAFLFFIYFGLLASDSLAEPTPYSRPYSKVVHSIPVSYIHYIGRMNNFNTVIHAGQLQIRDRSLVRKLGTGKFDLLRLGITSIDPTGIVARALFYKLRYSLISAKLVDEHEREILGGIPVAIRDLAAIDYKGALEVSQNGAWIPVQIDSMGLFVDATSGDGQIRLKNQVREAIIQFKTLNDTPTPPEIFTKEFFSLREIKTQIRSRNRNTKAPLTSSAGVSCSYYFR